MKIFTTVLILIFSIITIVLAQDTYKSAGTASNLFLRLGTNARVSGLAESFTGLADDENALFYNPGGLSNLRIGAVGLNHTEWFEDIRIDNITFAYQFNRQLGIGAGLSHMWMPSIRGKDQFGQETEAINVSSSVIQLGLAYKIISGFNVGIGMKYFIDNLAGYSASGFGFDVGFHFQVFLPGLSMGIATQNIGTEIMYHEEKEKIPLTFRGGLAYNFFTPSLIVTADIVKSIDTDYAVQSGVEYVFQEAFSLRMGSKYAINGVFTPTFGAGFHLKNQYNLYYTFVNYSDLGGTHRLGFAFNFNTPASKKWKRSLQMPGVPLELRPPQYIYARIKENELILSWEYVRGATYNVYARHSSQVEWKKLNKTPITSSLLKFKKPTLKGEFYFRVTSIMNNKESMDSKETSLHVE